MKYALLLWRDRVISVDMVQDIHGAGRPIKLKSKANKSSGKKISGYTTFSGTYWKDETNRFLKSIMTLNTEDMDEIIGLAKVAAKWVKRKEASALAADDGYSRPS
jgi:hypothetical protein